MVPVVSHPSSLLIRSVHVLAMALLLGGAVTTWTTLRFAVDPSDPDDPFPLRAAATYEWVFWAGAGLIVLTGVGNLGALAPGIPDPGTGWGATFTIKLAGVLGLLVASPIRILSVVRFSVIRGAVTGSDDVPVVSRLRMAYGATALYLLLVLALAEVLAHG